MPLGLQPLRHNYIFTLYYTSHNCSHSDTLCNWLCIYVHHTMTNTWPTCTCTKTNKVRSQLLHKLAQHKSQHTHHLYQNVQGVAPNNTITLLTWWSSESHVYITQDTYKYSITINTCTIIQTQTHTLSLFVFLPLLPTPFILLLTWQDCVR